MRLHEWLTVNFTKVREEALELKKQGKCTVSACSAHNKRFNTEIRAQSIGGVTYINESEEQFQIVQKIYFHNNLIISVTFTYRKKIVNGEAKYSVTSKDFEIPNYFTQQSTVRRVRTITESYGFLYEKIKGEYSLVQYVPHSSVRMRHIFATIVAEIE